MNRQPKNISLKNNAGRNQCNLANVKNNLKSDNAKTLNRTKSSPLESSTSSTHQKTTVPKYVQSKMKPSSAINLTSYAEEKKYQNIVPEKKVFGLRDIHKKDFHDVFCRQNISFNKGNVTNRPASKETKDLSPTKLIKISKKESKTERPATYSAPRLNVTKSSSDENITKDYKKKLIAFNILKKIKENRMIYKGLHDEKLGNRETANKKDLLIPITPELMQSLDLQPSDLSVLLKILQSKVSETNKSPSIKFSPQPFVRLKKLNTNKEYSEKKTFDIRTRLRTQNTNIVNETDCFISKVQGHFIDRSLYNKERKPVVAAPSLSTIMEEPEHETVTFTSVTKSHSANVL